MCLCMEKIVQIGDLVVFNNAWVDRYPEFRDGMGVVISARHATVKVKWVKPIRFRGRLAHSSSMFRNRFIKVVK